jgi:hypothetical protein
MLFLALCPQVRTEESFMSFLKAEPGTVLPKTKAITYDIEKVSGQSFSNTPCEHVYLLPGSTHVAVGFADLGELAAAASRWDEATAAKQAAAHVEELSGETQAQTARGDKQAQQEKQGKRGKQGRQARQGKQTRQQQQQQQQQQAASGNVQPDPVAHPLTQAHNLNVSRWASLASDSSSDSEGCAPVPATASYYYLLQVEQLLAQQLGQQQPLVWVGYDASPYAVAKAAVLLEMMQQGANTDVVLQVGLLTPKTNLQPAISMQIRPDPWRLQGQWSLNVSHACTGELLTAEVGSTVMCSLPRGAGAMAADEHFLGVSASLDTFATRTL